MPSDASIYSNVGAGVTPLLNPLDIQAKRLALQNEIARQTLIQQEQQKNALAIRQAQTDFEADQWLRSQTGPAAAPAPAGVSDATTAHVAALPGLPSGPSSQIGGGNRNAFYLGGDAAPAPASYAAPAPAAPAPAAAAAPQTAAHDIPDADILQHFGTKGYALIHARAEATKLASEIRNTDATAGKTTAETQAKTNDYWGSLAYGLQSVDFDAGAVHAVLNKAFTDGQARTPEFQMLARAVQMNDLNAVKQLAAQAVANSPEQQKLLNERTTAAAHAATAKTSSDRLTLETPGIDADNKLKALTAAGQAPIQPVDQARIALDRQRVGIEAARVSNERKKTEFDQGAIERAGEALGRGDLTRIQDIASLRGDQRLQIFDIAKRVNPNFNTAEVDRRIKNEDYYANGKGADSLRSFNTFLEHAGSASDAVNNIRLSGVPVINKPLNWWREHLSGSADYQRLVTSLEPVRKEFEGYLLGGHALQSDDRKAAEKILNENSSPAQIQEALKTLGHTAAARAREENFRYKKVSGHDLEGAFSPEAIEGAKKIGTELNFESAAPAAAPAIPAARVDALGKKWNF